MIKTTIAKILRYFKPNTQTNMSNESVDLIKELYKELGSVEDILDAEKVRDDFESLADRVAFMISEHKSKTECLEMQLKDALEEIEEIEVGLAEIEAEFDKYTQDNKTTTLSKGVVRKAKQKLKEIKK